MKVAWLSAIVSTAVFIVISVVFTLPVVIFALATGIMAGLLIGLFLSGLGGRHQRLVRAVPGRKQTRQSTVPFAPKLLETAINEMREGVLVIDAEMRVVASNLAARKLFSNVQGEIESRRLTELTRNPAIYDAFLDAVHGRERQGVKVETFDEVPKIFDLRVVPLGSNGGGENAGAVGVLFDITRLERLELVRQEFLSNVSHELRTPLTSIMALAETLEAGALNDEKNNRRFLSIIRKNAVRMQHLIDDILELSAIEAGYVSVNPESVRVRPLVDDVLSGLASTAAERDISMRNLVAPEVEVFADPHRLMQMLTNLIDNAVKFNRDEGTVSIAFEKGERDRIKVRDTGEGIASQHLDRLFERFYRVDRARSRDLGGTGLGLAIVKHLALAHGGEVTVESRFGEGTTFTIELPRMDRVAAERPLSNAGANRN